MKITYRLSFILILALHLLLLLPNIKFLSQEKKIGYTNITTINAHVYFTVRQKGDTAKQNRKTSNLSQMTSPNNLKINTHAIYTAMPMQNSTNSLTQKTNSITQGKNDELLMLLHNAISNAQIYPIEALHQGQTGEVSLRFKLSPNGTIEQLLITKSSGFSSLDQAAINTVKKIIPFEAAKKFLTQPEYFEIPIDFQTIET